MLTTFCFSNDVLFHPHSIFALRVLCFYYHPPHLLHLSVFLHSHTSRNSVIWKLGLVWILISHSDRWCTEKKEEQSQPSFIALWTRKLMAFIKSWVFFVVLFPRLLFFKKIFLISDNFMHECGRIYTSCSKIAQRSDSFYQWFRLTEKRMWPVQWKYCSN